MSGLFDHLEPGAKKDDAPSLFAHLEPKATAGGVLRALAAGGIDATGNIMQAGGEVLAKLANSATGTQDYRTVNPLKFASDYLRDGMTEGDKAAAQDNGAGNIFQPSTYELPKTIGGALHTVAQGAGSTIPLVAAGILTRGRSPLAMGAAEGAMTAGGAADEVRQNMAKLDTDEKLLAASPAYAKLIAGGMSPSIARDTVTNEGAQYAGLLSGIAGFGAGTMNGKLLEGVVAHKGIPALVGAKFAGQPIQRTVIGAGIGALAEGGQEVAEKLGQNAGENLGLGKAATDNIGRDTFSDFLGGAFTGGGFGAVGGAASRGHASVVAPDGAVIDPNAGPISRMAATAINSGAAQQKADQKTAETVAQQQQEQQADAQKQQDEAAKAFTGKAEHTDPRQWFDALNGAGQTALIKSLDGEERQTALDLMAQARSPEVSDPIRARAAEMLFDIAQSSGFPGVRAPVAPQAMAGGSGKPTSAQMDQINADSMLVKPTTASVQAPAAAVNPGAGAIAAWSAKSPALTLQGAQELQRRAAVDGRSDMVVVPHASGQGFTIVPESWTAPVDRANAQGIQGEGAGQLAAPKAPDTKAAATAPAQSKYVPVQTAPTHFFPFKSAEQAEERAMAATKAFGEEYGVQPHPSVKGAFAVVPASKAVTSQQGASNEAYPLKTEPSVPVAGQSVQGAKQTAQGAGQTEQRYADSPLSQGLAPQMGEQQTEKAAVTLVPPNTPPLKSPSLATESANEATPTAVTQSPTQASAPTAAPTVAETSGEIQAAGFTPIPGNTHQWAHTVEETPNRVHQFNLRQFGGGPSGAPVQFRLTQSTRFPGTSATGAPSVDLGTFNSEAAALTAFGTANAGVSTPRSVIGANKRAAEAASTAASADGADSLSNAKNNESTDGNGVANPATKSAQEYVGRQWVDASGQKRKVLSHQGGNTATVATVGREGTVNMTPDEIEASIAGKKPEIVSSQTEDGNGQQAEPNFEAAKSLLQAQKNATGNAVAEAKVRKQARELAAKTPPSHQKTVLALDTVATRLGMGEGNKPGLTFAEEPAKDTKQDVAAGHAQPVAAIGIAEHIEEGEAEQATPAAINTSLKTATSNTNQSVAELRQGLLDDIDARLKDAPTLDALEYKLSKDGEVVPKYSSASGAPKPMPFVVFDVPGDGKFKVQATQENLTWFRGQVASNKGFTNYKGTPQAKPSNADSTTTSLHEMLATAGEYETAYHLAQLKGKPLGFAVVQSSDRKSVKITPTVSGTPVRGAFTVTHDEATISAEQAETVWLEAAQKADAEADASAKSKAETRAIMATLDPQEAADKAKADSAQQAESANGPTAVDYKGFSRTQRDGGNFELSDGNMTVKVEALGGGKLQASFRGAKSSPSLQDEQVAVDWAANIRDDSVKQQVKPEPRETFYVGDVGIYPTQRNGKDVWLTQSEDNVGKARTFGDTIWETREQAVDEAKRVERRIKDRQDRAANDAMIAADAAAKKEANRNKSLAERRADNVLDKPHTYPAIAGVGAGSRREAMQKAVEQGRAITEEQVTNPAAKRHDEEVMALVQRSGYILGLSNENIPLVASGLAAQARLKADQYFKPEYRLYSGRDRTNGFWEITKTEFDYAQSLKAAEQQAEATAKSKAAETAKAAKIEDFGDKIGGARKDIAAEFKADLNTVADADIASQPLSKVWPAPDYQKLIDGGMDARVVSTMRALRDEVPAKPRVAWKIKGWAANVKIVRDMANRLLDGTLTVERLVQEGLNQSGLLGGLFGRIDLYQAVGHSKSLEGVSFQLRKYSLYKGKENVSLWVVEKAAVATAFGNFPHELASGKTKEEAIAAFKEKYASLNMEQAAREPTFNIYSERGVNGFFIGKKIGRNTAQMAGPFATIKEARTYRDDNLATLQDTLEKYKEIPRERGDVNQPRVGADMRNGQDVTPQMFGETFGFKGVEFGNWVEQKRRQQDINNAFDALMDMAAVLGIPAKSISLNGQLSLAFGARGSGGVSPAAAHYEPGKVVINLTKKEGAGSLGHEWWHALDNYFSRNRNRGGDMMTTASDVSTASRSGNFHPLGSGVRNEMITAFAEVVKAIRQTAMKTRSANLDAKRTTEYWSTGHEMSARAFESYLIAKLQDQNAANDYLANVVSEKTWAAMAALGMQNENSYPYPTAAETPAIRAGFDHFFSTIEAKPTDDGNIALGNTKDDRAATTQAWKILSANDDAFQFGHSDAKALGEIAKDYGGDTITVKPGIGGSFYITMKDGDTERSAIVKHYEGNKVALDISDFETGQGGSTIYQMVADYAHNTGQVFIGDPLGLSAIAQVRRTENMLSSALYWDTTDHLAPHKSQLRPDQKSGAVAMKWKAGDTDFNLGEMLRVSMENTLKNVPELRDVTYNFESRQFEERSQNGTVEAFTDAGFKKLATDSRGGIGATQAGSTTLKRAALTHTLVQTQGRAEWSRILGSLVRQSSEQLDPQLREILYQRVGKQDTGTTTAFDQLLHDGIAEGKTTTDTLKAIQQASKNPFYRELAGVLLKAGVNPTLELGESKGLKFSVKDRAAESFAAAFFPKSNKVRLFTAANAERNFLHEVMHAATFQAIRKGGLAAGQLKALFKHVQKSGKLEGMYGMENVDEFVAEAFSNPKFQAALKRVEAASLGGVLSHAFDRFVNIVRSILGLPKGSESALSQAIDIGSALIDQQRNMTFASLAAGVMGNVDDAIRVGDVFRAHGEAITVMRALPGGKLEVRIQGKRTRLGDFTNKEMKGFEKIGRAEYQDGFYTTPQTLIDIAKSKPTASQDGEVLGTIGEDRDMQSKVRDKLHDYMDTSKTFNNWWHKTVGTQYHKAETDRDFKRVYDATQQYIGDVSRIANAAADQSPSLLPKTEGLKDMLRKDVSSADRAAIAKPIYQGTLTDQKVYSVDELRSEFGLTDPQIGYYHEHRAAINQSLDDLLKTDVLRYVGKDAKAVRDAVMESPNASAAAAIITAQLKKVSGLTSTQMMAVNSATDDEAKAEAMAELTPEQITALHDINTVDAKAARVEQLKSEGYAPLMRFGQYAVHVTDDQGATVSFTLHEKERLANQAARALREANPEATVTQSIISDEAHKLYAGMEPETLELFAEMSGLEETPAFQQYLKMTKSNRSAMKRLIERKGIAGFNEDPVRSLASFITSNARAGSKNLHFGDMLDAAAQIPREKGDVMNEAVKLIKYVQDPQQEAQALRGLLFVNYIGGSVASALVNLTQPVMMTFPYLSQYGTGIAAKQMTFAMRAALGKTVANPELAAALKRAEADGVVSPQEIHQLEAEASSRFGSNQYVRKAAYLWGSMFGLAEQFNRRVTFIAAYNMASPEGALDAINAKREAAGREGFDSAFDFAEHAIAETQGVYNKGNRPDWARGAVGATLFTFKQFSISYLEFLKRLPRKEQVIAVGILLLAAGVQGLPGADDLDDLIDALGQGLGYDTNAKAWKTRALTAAIGRDGAEFVMRGGSALPGFPLDVAGRMSVGDLIPGTAMLTKTGNTAKELTSMLGAAGSFGTGLVDAAKSGDLMKAAPMSIRNLAKAADMYQSGMYRDEKGRKVIDTDGYDAFFKGIGFQPAEVALDSRQASMVQQTVALVKLVKSEIAQKWAESIVENDPAKATAAAAKLHDWNQKNPNSAIGITSQQITQRVKEMMMDRDDRLLKRAPKEIRAAMTALYQ